MHRSLSARLSPGPVVSSTIPAQARSLQTTSPHPSLSSSNPLSSLATTQPLAWITPRPRLRPKSSCLSPLPPWSTSANSTGTPTAQRRHYSDSQKFRTRHGTTKVNLKNKHAVGIAQSRGERPSVQALVLAPRDPSARPERARLSQRRLTPPRFAGHHLAGQLPRRSLRSFVNLDGVACAETECGHAEGRGGVEPRGV